MASNFKRNGLDIDNLFLKREDTLLEDLPISGKLFSWGNAVGLGIQTSSPTQVGSLTDWKLISLAFNIGGASVLSIKSDGSLWAIGRNLDGQLGLNDNIDRPSPVQVGSLTNWAKTEIGRFRGFAIKTDNTLWAWGNNTSGALGLNNQANTSSPVQVGALTNWKEVSSGYRHAIAVKTDGTLWSWGLNSSGELGSGTITARSSPVQVGALTNWKLVCAADSQSFAIKTDGTLWAWGFNGQGQLGLGNLVSRSSPTQVGSLTNWKLVSAGQFGTAAVKTDGTLWSWGLNCSGSLGLGDAITFTASSPVQVGSLTGWKEVSKGRFGLSSPSSAIKVDGTLWAWGLNNAGQLGLGDIISRSSPTQVGTLNAWKSVSAGDSSTIAIFSD